MILELGGGEGRPYPPRELKDRHLITGNIDIVPEWGDRQLQVDVNQLYQGLADPRLAKFFDQCFLGTAVLGHLVKFLDPANIESILRSAAGMILPGGQVIILDSNDVVAQSQMLGAYLRGVGASQEVHDMTYDRLRHAIWVMKRIAQESRGELRYRRFLLGPAFSEKYAKRIRNRERLTVDEVKAAIKKGQAEIVMVPVSDDQAGEEQKIGNKTLFPQYCEGVYVLEKSPAAWEEAREALPHLSQLPPSWPFNQ